MTPPFPPGSRPPGGDGSAGYNPGSVEPQAPELDPDPDATLEPGTVFRVSHANHQGLPSQLGKYSPVSRLGQGGIGEVFEARDPGLQRVIALKVLRPELAENPSSEQRFLREACSVGRLEHPNIPAVHEVGRGDDGHPYFTMRLIRGRNLEQAIALLKAQDPKALAELSFRRRAQVIRDVCDALAYAHRNGVLHRDIKPQNIMLGDSGEVVLIDWGVSKDSELDDPAPVEPGFLGTLRYAPPERLQAGFSESQSDARGDIYSLGAVMYELFTLTPPYPQNSPARLAEAILKDSPTRAERVAQKGQGHVPKEFADIIHTAMARDPSGRFFDAASFGQALGLAIDGQCPVVCVCTGLKRGLWWLDYLVNNRPVLVVLALLTWLLAPLLLGAYLWVAPH